MAEAEYHVEPGIPMPDPPGVARYPWGQMEVGESFFVPGRHSANMASTASAAGARLGRTFRVRTVVESGVKGVRVWRVEDEPVA